MSAHLDALSRLHAVWGIFGLLTGGSLGVLAAGTSAALDELASSGPTGHAAVWILLLVGGSLAAGGALMIVIGRMLAGRRRSGRLLALMFAALNLLFVPFGTALGIYTYWVLLNDDARREFGRPPRAPGRLTSVEPA